MTSEIPVVEMIPLDRIEIVNPRVRNAKVFREIVDNIAKVGLKRPITVAMQAGRISLATIWYAVKAG